MGGNTFGRLFRVTTWGESHGKALGAVVDGCPPGIKLNEDEINKELSLRIPKVTGFQLQGKRGTDVRYCLNFEGKL